MYMEINLHAQIRRLESQLSRSERSLSEAVVRLGHQLPRYSSVELAQYAGVSQSTVTRFFRKLGYGHYRHAVKEARFSFLHLQADALDIKNRVENANLEEQLELHLSNEIKNIRHTLSVLDEDKLRSVVLNLATCEKIWVVGFADDYSLAHLARSLLIRIKPDIRMIPLAGFPIAEEFSSINSTDVILAFTGKRISHIMAKLTESGQFTGAEIIQISDERSTSLPDVTQLTYATRGEFLFDSFSAAVSLISYICSEVAAVIGEPAVTRLYQIESLHEEWDKLQ
ncbi:MAG: DNA-binding MurR/RpiR family transcriptional regulator [Gammaproteobacteria bacterium]|jgi:DNA-binding MurR/RpiR family transcriptional regulator